jgi:hypothetical protein
MAGQTMCVWPGPAWTGLDLLAQYCLVCSQFVYVLGFFGGLVLFLLWVMAWITRFPFPGRERSPRSLCLSNALGCLVLSVLLLGAGFLSHFIRNNGFARASRRGDRICAALARFEADNRFYPDRLRELVPAYIEEIPTTGLMGYPSFYYRKGPPDEADRARSWWPTMAGYELGIHCSRGWVNWDRFFYWPTEEYPGRVYGGSVQPVGAWAYVHE